MDDIQEAKKLIAKARKANLRIMRQMELDRIKASFDEHVRRFARPTEEVSYDNLFKAAQRSIEGGGPDFEAQSSQLKAKAFMILWRQDWFVADRFRWYMEAPHLFADATHHAELVASGQRALAANDVEQLRKTVAELDLNRIASPDEDQLVAGTNIVRG